MPPLVLEKEMEVSLIKVKTVGKNSHLKQMSFTWEKANKKPMIGVIYSPVVPCKILKSQDQKEKRKEI